MMIVEDQFYGALDGHLWAQGWTNNWREWYLTQRGGGHKLDDSCIIIKWGTQKTIDDVSFASVVSVEEATGKLWN